jgi:hypothetical protein
MELLGGLIMENCGSRGGGGPFSVGRELVEFVYNAHDGGVKLISVLEGEESKSYIHFSAR